jgi:putative transcriptional regulator
VEKEEILKRVGDQIIKHRQQKGWTQADLAKACDKEPQSIERVENGKINASIFYLYEIATALNVTLSDLVKIN